MSDNIKHEDSPNVEVTRVDEDVDSYMDRFSTIESIMEVLKKQSAALRHKPHDEARVRALIEISTQQTILNEQLFDLMVEMNNFFGKST